MMKRLIRLLPIVLLLPLVVSAAWPSAAQENLQLDPRVGLNAYEALVEQEFAAAHNGLRTLAATEDVASGDWEHVKGPLAQFAKGVPVSAAVWFAKPDGSYFSVGTGLTGQNIKDRRYFPPLMAGKDVTGDLVVSKSTGKRSTIIAVPVRKDGHVIGALGVSVDMEKVAALVDNKIAFPNAITFYALDRHGQIALHRQSTLLFEFAQQLGSPSLKASVEEMLSKPEGVVHYEFQGAQREAIFKRSSSTGWIYALRW